MNQNILQYLVLGNRILDYGIFVLVFLGGLLALKMFKSVVLRRLKNWAQRTASSLDDFILNLLQHTFVPLAYFGAFYLGVSTLTLNPLLKRVIDVLGVALLTLFTARLIIAVIDYSMKLYLSRGQKDMALERSLNGIFRIVKISTWGLAIVFFLDNLGFKISAVIAGLGIGGVAVALAAQAILKDLFSYFCILFDRPFAEGDFIIIGDYLGAVEHIGIKTTRIRSLGGEQLIFSNTDLTDSRVRNYKRMQKRRVPFKIGVTYQTTLQQLKEMPKIIENVINNVKDTTFDRAHFLSYGDFSLIFEIVYYVVGADYNKYMDIQQEINFGLKEEFEKQGIEFAYPTQTLHLSKTDA